MEFAKGRLNETIEGALHHQQPLPAVGA
jgi:hypothetical protein